MNNEHFHDFEEKFLLTRPTHHSRSTVIDGAKAYVTVIVIVTILLSVWAGLCSA
jgi:hypothetical protein